MPCFNSLIVIKNVSVHRGKTLPESIAWRTLLTLTKSYAFYTTTEFTEMNILSDRVIFDVCPIPSRDVTYRPHSIRIPPGGGRTLGVLLSDFVDRDLYIGIFIFEDIYSIEGIAIKILMREKNWYLLELNSTLWLILIKGRSEPRCLPLTDTLSYTCINIVNDLKKLVLII